MSNKQIKSTENMQILRFVLKTMYLTASSGAPMQNCAPGTNFNPNTGTCEFGDTFCENLLGLHRNELQVCTVLPFSREIYNVSSLLADNFIPKCWKRRSIKMDVWESLVWLGMTLLVPISQARDNESTTTGRPPPVTPSNWFVVSDPLII
jgi:hypothetical protein